MDVKKLLYFTETVDQGSISKAAGRLGISQPALTKSLRELERELRVTLLDRSTSGVTATVYGHSLYAHARAIGAEIDHARDELEQLAGGSGGYVRLGALPSVAGGLIGRALARLSGERSDLRVRVVEKQGFELLPALRRREFDFVVSLADEVTPEAGIRHRVILRDRLRIVARRSHPLAREPAVGCADLVRYPWVHPVVGTTYRPILKQLFKGTGIEPPQPAIECGSAQFAKTVMSESDALGLLPAHLIAPEIADGSLVCLPVESDDLARTIAVFYSGVRPLSSAARQVMAAIERSCAEFMAAGEAGRGP